MFLGESTSEHKYVLLVKDDLIGYCWLGPTSTADAEQTSKVLSEWTRTFTTPSVSVSDQESHFKNEVVEHLERQHNIRHYLTIAYSPCTNGKAEALMRPVLAATRSMLSELKLAPHDWMTVVPSIATALNEAPLPRLGFRPNGIARCPLEVMTGIKPRRPILRVIPRDAFALNGLSVAHSRALQIFQIQELQ